LVRALHWSRDASEANVDATTPAIGDDHRFAGALK
jgi:hypothetical protein